MSIALNRNLVIAVTAAFAVYTAIALADVGLGGTADAITFNLMAGQIFIDLVIAILLIDVWVYADATRRGRSPWPWIVLSFIAGSFGPLGYLIARSFDEA